MNTPAETPNGFISHAKAFFRLAFLPDSDLVPLATYSQLGRSIELSLKAFLMADGMTIGQLKAMGHNLKALLHTAFERKIHDHISIGRLEIGAIIVLSSDYRKKRLDYVVSGGTYYLPSLDLLSRVAYKLAWQEAA